MRGLSGTVVARAFDVVVGGYSRKQKEGAFAELLGATQNDLGASVVILDRSLDFDLTAFELPNVAHLLEIGREYDYGERTRLCSLQKFRNVTPLVPFATWSTVPLTHCIEPTCLLASAKATQVFGSISRGTNHVRHKDGRS